MDAEDSESLYWPSRGTRVGLTGGRGQGEVLTVLVSTRRQHKHKTSTHAQRTTQAGLADADGALTDSRHEHEHRTPRGEEPPLVGADPPSPQRAHADM